jgi:hypothetical protein
LLERDSFDLFLPEFDKPWVIHLRETCCCSTNLCTWRPNTVYKNRRVRRHQGGAYAKRPRDHKASKTDLRHEASAIALGNTLKSVFADKEEASAKRDEQRRRDKEDHMQSFADI